MKILEAGPNHKPKDAEYVIFAESRSHYVILNRF